MVSYMLLIAADFNNIKKLEPNDGVDDPEFCYYLKVKCSRCREINPKEVCLSLDVTEKVNKDTVHLSKNCDLCARNGTVKMIPGEGIPLANTWKKQYSPLMAFECDGYELLDFVFSRGWSVESVAGSVYHDVDFTNGDFVAEEAGVKLKVSNLKHHFKQVDLKSPKKKGCKSVVYEAGGSSGKKDKRKGGKCSTSG